MPVLYSESLRFICCPYIIYLLLIILTPYSKSSYHYNVIFFELDAPVTFNLQCVIEIQGGPKVGIQYTDILYIYFWPTLYNIILCCYRIH